LAARRHTAGPDSPTATEKAIASDPDLTPTERAAVLNVYRGFRSRHGGGSAWHIKRCA